MYPFIFQIPLSKHQGDKSNLIILIEAGSEKPITAEQLKALISGSLGKVR